MARRAVSTFAAALENYRREAIASGWAAVDGLGAARVVRVFGRLRITALTEDRIAAYTLDRQDAGAHARQINAELGAISRVLHWAHDQKKILGKIPTIQFLHDERSGPYRPRHSFHSGSAAASPQLVTVRQPRFRSATSSLSPSMRRRGKLPAEALAEHLRMHPIGKRKRDGSSFSDNDRVAALRREQGIEITRTALVKRLGPIRKPGDT
jgi:hypothetical protein